MSKQSTTSKLGALSRFFKATFSAGLLAVFVLLLSGHTSQAGSATWRLNSVSGDWNMATNWTPTTVPNGEADMATFHTSDITDVSLSASIEVNGIIFSSGASPFSVAVDNAVLRVSGSGVTNNSGIGQNFLNGVIDGSGGVQFSNNATAATLTTYTSYGSTVALRGGGFVEFINTSDAGNGFFINQGGAIKDAGGGGVDFRGSSSAATGTFINNGATITGAFGAFSFFLDTSTAGNGTFVNNGGNSSKASSAGNIVFLGSSTGGEAIFRNNGGITKDAHGGRLSFLESSSAGNATLIANGGSNGGAGGSIQFFRGTTGGTSRVEVFGNGNLTIGDRDITVGSVEGDGEVFLGGKNLSIGSNNLSTDFSGVIQDGGLFGRTGGSLGKIGRGKLVLRHANSYTGGTTVKQGKLISNNRDGSGTGSGPVKVKGGKLGGKGMIAGAVTIGTGSGSGAVLAPGYLHGVNRPGALTIQSPLTFNSDGIYQMELNSSNVTADEVIANSVTINTGAQFSFVDFGSASLPTGTVFTAISNTAAIPIAGAFVNLPDGSTFTSNGNTYRANYEGGDGNDLILTVMP